MELTQIVGLLAGTCTACSMLPQLIKTVKEKQAEEISILMLMVLIAGVSTWIVYGVLKKDFPIIVTNGISLVLNIVMMFLRIKYRHK